MSYRTAFLALPLAAHLLAAQNVVILDKQKALDAQTFWDNRDWDWRTSRSSSARTRIS